MEETTNKSELRKLAEFIHDLTWEALPEEVRNTVPLRVLDLVSVAVGAVHDPLVEQAREALSSLFGSENGKAKIWGENGNYPPVPAAMINAMHAHTLELDDVHTASKTHGSASLIPAAWACAQALGKSGKEFLLAVVCGYETVNRVGMAFGVSSHRNRGWHATATCGVFGCAAACAKLLNLDTDQIVSALGLAGTQSSGVWAFLGDGSNCKVLHTARAAADGMEAAFLAKAGMTGPEHIFEAKDGGLLTAMSDGGDLKKLSAGLGTVYEILNMDMKPYPCCRSAHGVIDAAFEIRKELLKKADLERTSLEKQIADIRQVQIETYLVGYKQCAVSEGCLNPKTTLDAKFSTPYAAAAALLYGKISMKEFELEVVEGTEIQRLLHKVHVEPADEFTKQYPKHWGCRMKVLQQDGTGYEKEIRDPSGSIARPLTTKQAMKKAEEFLHESYPGEEQVKIREILNLEEKETLPNM
jgi:2-methylcitrate dehydratase PrpD